ncbi:MAG: VOC family protein [Spirochaetaceae bacterium]|nr:MAG: VOC family protein [Spirochaetaceae bacterium]
MNEYIISGIQQIGAGIPDLDGAFRWYRKKLGFDIRVFEDDGEAALMLPYTGGKPRARHAILALNLQGGGGLEVWQYKSRKTQAPEFQVRLGDLGIFSARIKARDVRVAFTFLQAQDVELLGGVTADPSGTAHFFLRDPFGLIFQVIESNGWFLKTKYPTGGAAGCSIGSSDVDKSREFYAEILGYDSVIYDRTGVFDDLKPLPGGSGKFRRMLLSHSQPRRGAFSPVLGPTRIELFQSLDRQPRKIFADRYWGDLGFIHVCFDVNGMDKLKRRCEQFGQPFTVDSASGFDMGDSAGRFAYAEDPDGTLIEFVEPHKLEIVKKWGWYLDLTKRHPDRALPRWMLRSLAFNRVKD